MAAGRAAAAAAATACRPAWPRLAAPWCPLLMPQGHGMQQGWPPLYHPTQQCSPAKHQCWQGGAHHRRAAAGKERCGAPTTAPAVMAAGSQAAGSQGDVRRWLARLTLHALASGQALPWAATIHSTAVQQHSTPPPPLHTPHLQAAGAGGGGCHRLRVTGVGVSKFGAQGVDALAAGAPLLAPTDQVALAAVGGGGGAAASDNRGSGAQQSDRQQPGSCSGRPPGHFQPSQAQHSAC